jgi:hypothetical protein
LELIPREILEYWEEGVQRTTMSPIKNELLPSPKVVTPIHPELIKHYLVGYDMPSTNFLFTGFTQGILKLFSMSVLESRQPLP